MKEELVNYLSNFITQNRLKRFYEIIENRTRYITIVLEDIYQPHNASAVLRTCDCLGIQDVHIIENKNKYTINPDVALGASKWLNLFKYNKNEFNTVDAINYLKNNDYRIIATTPHSKDVELQELDLENGKIALLFGTELTGLTQKAIDNADEYLKIPMYGFTESFNISVSAAIIIHHLIYKIKNSTIRWKLSKKEKKDILLQWLKNSIKNSSLLEEKFLKEIQ